MPSTASLCDCFSQLKSELAKASLDALSNSGSQLDPASALVYEAYADIADCFTKVSPFRMLLAAVCHLFYRLQED